MIDIESFKERHGIETAFMLLVIRAFFGVNKPQDIDSFIDRNEIDWKQMLATITRHRIRPVFLHGIRENTQALDPTFLRMLREDVVEIAVRNMNATAELIRLCKLFSAHSIDVIPFKGPVLSYILNEDVGMREFLDLDFLVKPNRIREVSELLIDNSYFPEYKFPVQIEEYMSGHACQKLFIPPLMSRQAINVEMQWDVLPPHFASRITNERLFETLQEITLGNEQIKTLSTENSLITMLLHHGAIDCWHSFKHLVDLNKFLMQHSSTANWSRFFKEVETLEMYHVSRTGFHLVMELFGWDDKTIVVNPFREKKGKNLIDRVFSHKQDLAFKHLYSQFLLVDSAYGKLLFLIRTSIHLLFIPNANDFNSFTIKHKWFFLYHILKPFRLLTSFFRRTDSNPTLNIRDSI